MKSITIGCALLCVMGACAPKPSKVQAVSVSTSTYQFLDCDQMREEAQRIDRKLAVATEDQNDTRDLNLFLGMGVMPVGTILAGDHSDDIASLKGQQIAVRQAFNERGCKI